MLTNMLTERYGNIIDGMIAFFDRILIRGTLPGWNYAGGMTSFLYAHKIQIFDYVKFAEPLTQAVRDNADRISHENGIEIEFIRKIGAFRKEDKVQEILKQRGTHPGLVHIFSAMETCDNYRPWYDKKTGNLSLKPDSGRCLHYYFYFIDEKFGLCYLRVPTWCPFNLQFYFNGHNWLARKMDKEGIAYELRDNAFLSVEDYGRAQALIDGIRIEELHDALDIFARRYCPVAEKFDFRYRWSIVQAEYSTDIIFKKQSDLAPIYESLVLTAIHSVKPDNIASFLGQKLHGLYQGEMGNNFNKRIPGTRIKHQMGAVSIKMYDKFGRILRIETTVNDVSHFKHFREVQQRDGTVVMKQAQMKKTIYSLYSLAGILNASNRRYLEFISTFDDPSQGIKNLNKVSETVETNNRRYRGFNFFSSDDQKLLEVLSRGEFNINGLRNKSLQAHFPERSSSAISAILKRLRTHGLIKKVKNLCKYYLTKLGKAVITAGLAVKQMILVPELAGIPVFSR